MNRFPLRIGTRGSPLALAQAEEVRGRLAAAHGLAVDAFEIVVIKTTGDLEQDRPLSEVGGKGLFTREIDAALVKGEIDVAAHSAKDLPTAMPEGVAVPGFLPREDARDCFVSARYARFADLPRGARLGTSSQRRQAFARRLRPDIRVELIRGNVGTRIAKVETGEFDATILALAGLKRLNLEARASEIFTTDRFLPAVGQGAIGMTARADDAATLSRLKPILDAATGVSVTAERAFLAKLEGNCRTPIAGHASLQYDRLILDTMVLSQDGAWIVHCRVSGTESEAEALGRRAGEMMLEQLPEGLPSSAPPA